MAVASSLGNIMAEAERKRKLRKLTDLLRSKMVGSCNSLLVECKHETGESMPKHIADKVKSDYFVISQIPVECQPELDALLAKLKTFGQIIE
jgi:predicted glycosyltransferase